MIGQGFVNIEAHIICSQVYEAKNDSKKDNYPSLRARAEDSSMNASENVLRVLLSFCCGR